MIAVFQHQEGAHRPVGKTGTPTAGPHRLKFFGQIVSAELEQQQQLLAFAVIGAADERNLTVAGLDSSMRNSHRVDTGRFFAHEGARRSGDAVYDRNVAGKQIRELSEEQRRAQRAHELFVEKGLRS